MKIITLCIALLTLQACSRPLYEQGTITQTRAQVVENNFTQKNDLSIINDAYLEGLARHYDKYGDKAVSLEIIYDPNKKSAAAASNEVAGLAHALHTYGVTNIKTDILPVRGENSLIVSYPYYTAKGPKNCETMQGYRNTDIGGNPNYTIGCTVETLIARQVSNPKDLLGQENTDRTTDGRSAANIVNAVRAGTRNQPLGGESASNN